MHFLSLFSSFHSLPFLSLFFNDWNRKNFNSPEQVFLTYIKKVEPVLPLTLAKVIGCIQFFNKTYFRKPGIDMINQGRTKVMDETQSQVFRYQNLVHLRGPENFHGPFKDLNLASVDPYIHFNRFEWVSYLIFQIFVDHLGPLQGPLEGLWILVKNLCIRLSLLFLIFFCQLYAHILYLVFR